MKRYHTKKGLTCSIYQHQKNLSNRRGHKQPDYTLDELRSWIYSQSEFNEIYEEWANSNFELGLNPSVDRIDSAKSYTLDNIQLLTLMDNWKKGNERNRQVAKYDTDGKLIKVYESIADAKKENNIKQSCIERVCKGKRKTTGGFIWKYTLSKPSVTLEIAV